MNNFLGYSELDELDEIDYFLNKLEQSKKHLKSYLNHYNYGSLYDPPIYMITKEIFDLINIQNQCNRVKDESIKLIILLKNKIEN